MEDKGLTLSVHYRTVAEDKTDEVRNIFERVIATARSLGKVRTTSGKKVYEVTASGRKALNEACGEFVAIFQGIFGDFYCTKCAKK